MRSLFIFILIFLSSMSYAAPEIVVAPNCLLSDIKYNQLAQIDDLNLIEINNIAALQTAGKKNIFYCRGFMNVTAAWKTYSKKTNPEIFLQRYVPSSHPSDFTRGYRVQHQEQVNPLLKEINATNLENSIKTLSDFPDRHVNSISGVSTAAWIKTQIQTMIKFAKRNDVSVYEIKTINRGKQPSIVLKIGSSLSTPGIVIGAHMDTTKSTPGADDDASGSAVVLETARVLLNSEFPLQKPIYLIWYAGQEEGNLGSQSVIQAFNRQHINIDAVLQLDMVGYTTELPSIGLTDGATDAGLTAFIADLVTAYIKVPVGAVRCGYACSDHATWYLNGNRVAYPIEVMAEQGNPDMHSRRDTLKTVSISHVMDFTKLSLAFAVELGS